MNSAMLRPVLAAVVTALTNAGLNAGDGLAQGRGTKGEPSVRVGLKKGSARGAGLGGYLGTRAVTGGGQQEIYGCRLELSLGLDLRGRDEADCQALFEQAAQALDTLPAGLCPLGFTCGETKPETASGLYLCRAQLDCRAMLLRSSTDSGETFTDFILEGVMTDGE